MADLSSAYLKIQKLEEKASKQKEVISSLRKNARTDRKTIKRLGESRDSWKSKNKSKSLTINSLTKRLSRQDKAARHHYPMWLVELSSLLRTQCGVSYGQICKIIVLLSCCFQLQLNRVPCANTIQNWVSKWGYYRLNNVGNQLVSNNVCLLLDESISMGNERVLLVLACDADKVSQKALSYEQVHVCYLGSDTGWTSASISEKIKELAKSQDWQIEYLLSDGGSNLKKTADLLKVNHVPDISHAIAHCLRKTFEKEEAYQKFLKLISSYQSKIVNGKKSYLSPPKQRKKARFMNQKALINWALGLLARYDRLEEKEAIFFQDLSTHQTIINTMKACLELGQVMALMIKEQGLNDKSLKALKKYGQIKKANPFVQQFQKYLWDYLMVYEELLNKSERNCFHACSDIIESMFGAYKNKKSQNPLVGLSWLGLELACLGKKPEKNEIKAALEANLLTNLKKWLADNSSESQASKRREFFNN